MGAEASAISAFPHYTLGSEISLTSGGKVCLIRARGEWADFIQFAESLIKTDLPTVEMFQVEGFQFQFIKYYKLFRAIDAFEKDHKRWKFVGCSFTESGAYQGNWVKYFQNGTVKLERCDMDDDMERNWNLFKSRINWT